MSQKNNPFSSAKTCSDCNGHRVFIAENYKKKNLFSKIIAVPIIYVPFMLGGWLFLFIIGYFCYCHLKMLGASKSLKKFSDFLPEKKSHRYNYKTQIVMGKWYSLNHSKLFWIFNCTWYCPISVALLEWCTYLVKIVEVWWCPFHHSKKENYVPISASFWHTDKEVAEKLHPNDRDNPMYNSVSSNDPSKKEE